MAWTEADLVALDRAIKSGVLTVEQQGDRITYRSMEDMLRARALIKAEMAAAVATASIWPTRRRVVRFSTGLASSDTTV